MEKVGVYCRLSDEDRYKKNKNDDSESIVNQKSMLLKYALERNWEVVDIYSDDDYSGAGAYRPDFERLIKDCESGRINLVLCKTQSRFSRDMEVVERYLHNKFVEWGVRFVSIVDNADTDNEANKKSRQINGLVNEWYLEDLSNNIKRSLKNKRDDGLFMGSFAPYGYLKDPNDKHKLIIDYNVAHIVKEIFEKSYNGIGYYKIAQSLNKRGIPSPSMYKKEMGSNFVCCNLDYAIKGQWTSDSIASILHNEVYIGMLVQGKRTNISYKNHKSKLVPKKDWSITENAHEPIIDMETWRCVRRRLDKRETPLKNGTIHMFSQKVYCDCCHKVFARNLCNIAGPNHKKVKRAYLNCKGCKKYHICDNNRSIRYDELEAVVLQEINKLIKKCNKELLKEKCNREFNSSQKDKKLVVLKKERSELQNNIDIKKAYFKHLYEDKLKNIISEEDFITLRDGYTKDIDIYLDIIEKIDKEIESIEGIKEEATDIELLLKKYKKIKKLDKFVIDEFIHKIYIGKLDLETNTRDIKIEWNLDL